MQNDTNNQIDKLINDIEFLTRVNVALTSDHDFKANIERALKLIGNHLGTERIHIIDVQPDRSFSALHEWCSDSVAPIKRHLQNKAYTLNRVQEKELYENGYAILEEKDEQLHTGLREAMKQYATKKVILFPLYVHGDLFSFIAFSQCNHKDGWNQDDIRLMMRIADVIAANLGKNMVISKLFYHVSQYARNAQARQ